MFDNSPAANATVNAIATTLDHANVRTRNKAGSTTGDACRADRHQNNAPVTKATTNDAITRPLPQPQSGAFTKPSASAPIATTTSPTPARSGSWADRSCRASGNVSAAITNATKPIGTLTRKTHRQDAATNSPPATGPAAAARPPVAAQIRTARVRRAAGTAVISRPRLVGVSAAAPTACKPRNATSGHRPGLSAHAALPMTNTARPSRNPAFWPYRSASRPNGTSSAA
jgi:hypothetical protein